MSYSRASDIRLLGAKRGLRNSLIQWAALSLLFIAFTLISLQTALAQAENAEGEPLVLRAMGAAVLRVEDRQQRVLKSKTEHASELLYVLDSNNKERDSQVLLVDPGDGRIVRTFKGGYTPDMALSPDGKRLYLASTWWTPDRWGDGTLDVIDTATGTVLRRVDNPDRGLSTVPEYPSKMVISQNGRWLYIYKVHQTLDGDEHYVATFDTVKGRFLSEVRKTPFCGGYGTLQPLLADRQLAVVCRESSDVRFLDLTPKPKAGNGVRLLRADEINEPRQKVSILSKGSPEHGRRVGPSFLSMTALL